MIVSLDRQITCVRREVALRGSVYPGLVAKGRLAQANADEEIAVMTSILETLEQLKLLVTGEGR